MEAVVTLATRRANESARATRAPFATASGQVIEFRRPATSIRHQELQLLNRALTALARSKADGNAADLAEWRDELEVMALHTAQFDIRERCQQALRRN